MPDAAACLLLRAREGLPRGLPREGGPTLHQERLRLPGVRWGGPVSILDQHAGHRAYLRGGPRNVVECVTCSRRLELPLNGVVLAPRFPTPDEQCPTHRGEYSDNCGRCRADQLEALEPLPPHRRLATDEGIAAARALYEQARKEKPNG